MVSIWCFQSLSVINSCFFFCHFSSLILCHLCGFNLVLSVVLYHWLLCCGSFFSHYFLSLLVVSIWCFQSLSVINSCFFFCHFSSLILCHLCGFNLVLSVVLYHWLLCCGSFFSHYFLSLLVVSILCCQSFSVFDSCFVCPFSSLILCHLCGLNLVLSITLCH